MSDTELLRILVSSKLTEQQTAFFKAELARVELGITRMSPVNRRHAEAIARAHGLMPDRHTLEFRSRKKAVPTRNCGDVYSDKRTVGTAFAEQLINRYRKRICSRIQAKLGLADERKGAA